jgi:hypothetical protein
VATREELAATAGRAKELVEEPRAGLGDLAATTGHSGESRGGAVRGEEKKRQWRNKEEKRGEETDRAAKS